MEQSVIGELQHHTAIEIANHYACQKIVKAWTQQSEYPSSQVIPSLHQELMRGVDEYRRKGLVPLAPGAYRTTEVTTEGRVDNFFVASTDVKPVMQLYNDELTRRLKDDVSDPANKLEHAMQDAAWAYYAFERIHPFLDGNGRVGRMILKRVMKGRGYKDIIFQPNEIYSKGENRHIQAMDAVHDSGNLAHLELYLLSQVKNRYTSDNNPISQQVDTLMEKKREEITSQTARKDLTEIWDRRSYNTFCAQVYQTDLRIF